MLNTLVPGTAVCILSSCWLKLDLMQSSHEEGAKLQSIKGTTMLQSADNPCIDCNALSISNMTQPLSLPKPKAPPNNPHRCRYQ